ncbi:MAG TPA: DUF4145 domain-containing protein [Phycisphaerales bacterium]|nr:DUF4145 domain-containing protein [Phycisphaerales bacterium]
MPSDVDRAVRWSKRFEAILGDRYGAKGRGLHEKIDSVESDLPERVVRDLRLVATVRNRLVHEDGYERIERRGEFLRACRRGRRALMPRAARWRGRIILVLLALGAFGVLALMQGLSVIQIFPRLG